MCITYTLDNLRYGVLNQSLSLTFQESACTLFLVMKIPLCVYVLYDYRQEELLRCQMAEVNQFTGQHTF
jgi:hypothetical protein